MAKTKEQKGKVIEKNSADIKNATNLIFADFGGTKTADIRTLRSTLKGLDSRMEVIKKRLLKIILKTKGIDFDPKQFAAQVGTIFVRGEISEVAGPVYKFSKDKEKFKMLGGIDLIKGESIDGEFLKRIGQLPPREVLLAQVLGGMVAPLRAFMWIIQERSKKMNS
ncbi:MAG: 50S ribosomal protein L10 [Candidatus Colwellbacteria bacterium RIFCSPHIGHO2_12_FULL_43_12]|uniref:Large ribosomal subunit protein uL10 n=2 Tax=Candidatus Colwelliibacteriota TaxID=1817904 RepID=A0A1G1Z179_9BACT|nr:MAG: 50S ribosomal protein L10 [Candidatus Colwellbacteria bacterium RIFCSPHIGHO2_12_FULL_43_12]OGY61313.1 MAG: 50S ribosomal protein L10 [Candidatus Colwellbacteria bacterium RIFCSPLOWO2_12_FULL_43_11]